MSEGKLLLKAGRSTQDMYFRSLSMKRANMLRKLLVLNEWIERMAVREDCRLPLYLTFFIYLVREILSLLGKCQ